MDRHLSPDQFQVYNAIDKILWEDWDPIGVNDIEEARNEYNNYVPNIFSLKIRGTDTETLALKLYEIQTQSMGVYSGLERCKEIAQKIINL